jgi:hypothetical protein
MKLRTILLATVSTAAGLVLLGSAPAHAANATRATVQPVPNAAPVAYTVEMQTGNVEGAGTDSSVSIRFYGSIRTSPWVQLDNAGDDRERNQLDVYGPIYLSDLGSVNRIDIYYDHTNSSPDWYLAWVSVYPTGSGPVSFFEFYDWMRTAGTRTIDAS